MNSEWSLVNGEGGISFTIDDLRLTIVNCGFNRFLASTRLHFAQGKLLGLQFKDELGIIARLEGNQKKRWDDLKMQQESLCTKTDSKQEYGQKGSVKKHLKIESITSRNTTTSKGQEKHKLAFQDKPGYYHKAK